MKLLMSLMALAIGFASPPGSAAPSRRFAVTRVDLVELGTLGGTQSVAYDINNGGYIVGWATTAAGEKHAFYYLSNASYMYDIGAHTGLGQSEARGINNSKEVVGFTEWSSFGLSHAFYWYAGGHLMLEDADPDPANGRLYSKAYAISDSGLIAGVRIFRDVGPSYQQATVWSDHNTFHPLYSPRYPWDSYAFAVNASNQVVAYDEDYDFAHRWQWSPAGSTSTRVPGVTGSYYGLYGWPLGINDNGAVVGSDLVGGASHAVLWNGVSATSTDLGVMSGGGYSVAEDVNNANFVAGYGDRTIPQPPPFTPVTTDAGFLWHPDFGKYELPGIPGNLFGKCRAHALNERQSSSGLVQVVGYCTDTTGAVRAVRWDVTVTSVSILPPPFRP